MMAVNFMSLIVAAVYARLALSDVNTNATLDLPPGIVANAKSILHADCGEACIEVVVRIRRR